MAFRFPQLAGRVICHRWRPHSRSLAAGIAYMGIFRDGFERTKHPAAPAMHTGY